MDEAARAPLLATVCLLLALMERGVACALISPADQVPSIRVAGIDTIEAVGLADDSYEIWSTNDPPDPVPLLLGQSLAETVQLLSLREGRA